MKNKKHFEILAEMYRDKNFEYVTRQINGGIAYQLAGILTRRLHE